ncbi:MAG: hypothetical protein IKC63_07500 [Clostridia bacterium]|nr:hypothetical protein [Clostridia bacterium]
MITYVINTSKSTTLNSNLLFDLAGYKRIHWLFSSLDEISACADRIVADQNKLIEDELRVAVILDFHGYDKVRLPHDDDPDKVHLDVYKPYLLAHLVKNLFQKIQKRGCRIASSEVFYIQNNVDGSSNDAANRNEEVAHIFSLPEHRQAFARQTLPKITLGDDATDEQKARKKAEEAQVAADEAVLATPYECFQLHLSEDSSLTFSAKEYCYKDTVTLNEFIETIRVLMIDNKSIVRHIHRTTGEMSVHAAYDNLTLSLFLIREYENNRTVEGSETTAIVAKLETLKLQKYLRSAYAKIDAAREIALDDEGVPRYYSLKLPQSSQRKTVSTEEDVPVVVDSNITVDDMYTNILTYASHSDSGMDEEDIAALDELVNTYISESQAKRENAFTEEFEAGIATKKLEKTMKRCPTEDDYQKAVKTKRAELEGLLSSSLEAEYVNVKFDDEKKLADKEYEKYHNAKADYKRHLLGDTLLFVLTLLVMIIPYAALQCYQAPFSLASLILYGIAAGVFGGLLIFCYFVHLVPVANRMRRAENEMRKIYRSCLEKRKTAFAKLKKRYEQNLPDIETIRYEIREIKRLHEMNREIFCNITLHREMLEDVAIILKSMMSQLDIPIDRNRDERVDHEFDPDKPIMDPANRIYKVLSLDNIKNLFMQEGR